MPITTLHRAPRRRVSPWTVFEVAVAVPLMLAGLTGYVECMPAPMLFPLVLAAGVVALVRIVAAVADILDGPKP